MGLGVPFMPWNEWISPMDLEASIVKVRRWVSGVWETAAMERRRVQRTTGKVWSAGECNGLGMVGFMTIHSRPVGGLNCYSNRRGPEVTFRGVRFSRYCSI
jgi:hypothetical protein